MYNFEEADAHQQLMKTLNNKEYNYIPDSGYPYTLFETYIQKVYEEAMNEDEIQIEKLNNAFISVAFKQFYPEFDLPEMAEVTDVPTEMLVNLLTIELLEMISATPSVKKSTYAYFCISKFLISSWEKPKIQEFLSEEIFKPSAVYLRMFLRSYAYVDNTFQPCLESLLKKNLFYRSRPVAASLEITSASQLKTEMVRWQSREFGDEFISSFLAETDLTRLRAVLSAAFRQVNKFDFAKADEEHIATLGSLFVHYLHQSTLQNQLSHADIRRVLQFLNNTTYEINFRQFDQVLGNTEATFNFLQETCNEIQYVLLGQYMKYLYSDIVLNMQEINNRRFTDIIGSDVPILGTLKYILETYPIRDDSTKTLHFERHAPTITLGTMTLTDKMISTFNSFLRPDGGWSEVYTNKILMNLIIPFIHMKMENYPCDVNERNLLAMLLLFSKSGLARKVESNALNNIIKFVERMVEEDNNNLKYFVQFLSYLRQHYFCLVRRNDSLLLINERFDFTYNIEIHGNIISNIFENYSADIIAGVCIETLDTICTDLLQTSTPMDMEN